MWSMRGRWLLNRISHWKLGISHQKLEIRMVTGIGDKTSKLIKKRVGERRAVQIQYQFLIFNDRGKTTLRTIDTLNKNWTTTK